MIEKFTYAEPRKALPKKRPITFMRFSLENIDALKKFCGDRLFYHERIKRWAIGTLEDRHYQLGEIPLIIVRRESGEIRISDICSVEAFHKKYDEVDA